MKKSVSHDHGENQRTMSTFPSKSVNVLLTVKEARYGVRVRGSVILETTDWLVVVSSANENTRE